MKLLEIHLRAGQDSLNCLFFLKDVGLGLAKLLRRRPHFQRGGELLHSAKAKTQSAELGLFYCYQPCKGHGLVAFLVSR